MGAQETARRTIRTGRILLAMLVLVPAGFCLLTGRLAVLGTMGSALSILSVAVALTIGSVQPLWNRVEGRLFSALYDKRIDDAGLGLLE